MPKFHVYGSVVGSKYLGVFEAASEDEAIDLALASDEGSISLCHQCASQMNDPEITECTAELDEE